MVTIELSPVSRSLIICIVPVVVVVVGAVVIFPIVVNDTKVNAGKLQYNIKSYRIELN